MKTLSEFLLEATAPMNIGAVRRALEKSLSKFATVEGTPGEIAGAIRRHGKKWMYGVSVRTSPNLEPGDISVWGFYDGDIDRHYVEDGGTEMPIEIILIFSPKEKKLALTAEGVKGFARYVAETIAHENIHLSQERKRGWKNIKPKQKYLHKVENIKVGSYLANDDEIEAHALNIAGSLLDQFGDKKKAIDFLKRPKTGVVSDHHFDMYLTTFGRNHAVVKRLYKKIIFYINNRT